MTTQTQHRKAKARSYTHCRVCGQPKKIPSTRQKGVPVSEYERDPYCSSVCCKLDHDVASSSTPTSS